MYFPHEAEVCRQKERLGVPGRAPEFAFGAISFAQVAAYNNHAVAASEEPAGHFLADTVRASGDQGVSGRERTHFRPASEYRHHVPCLSPSTSAPRAAAKSTESPDAAAMRSSRPGPKRSMAGRWEIGRA